MVVKPLIVIDSRGTVLDAAVMDKKAFNKAWEPKIDVVKGRPPQGDYEVDGLSGATLTANGVEDLVRFWLGEEGYGPILPKLRTGGDHG